MNISLLNLNDSILRPITPEQELLMLSSSMKERNRRTSISREQTFWSNLRRYTEAALLTRKTEKKVPFGLAVAPNTNYANWEPVEINGGKGIYLDL